MHNKLSINTALIVATALALSPLSALGQIAADTEAEAPQYYQVEVVVFRHLDQSNTTGEIPRMPEPEMADLLEQDLARLAGDLQAPMTSDNTAASEVSELDETTAPRFVSVDGEKLLLETTVQRIADLPIYEIVSYLSWGQTAPDVTVAEALDVTELGADPATLGGTIELHQRRYLHLALELTLTDGDAAAPGYLDSQQLPRGSAALPILKDSRRMRLEKLQYFDQPSFGAIAVVSRLELPTDESANLQDKPAEDVAAVIP